MSAFEPVQMPDHELASPEARKRYEKLCYKNFVKLGGTNIEVHLEDDDFQTGFENAVGIYRRSSERSTFRSYGVLQLEMGRQEYVLDEKIDNVVNIWRQSNRSSATGPAAVSLNPLAPRRRIFCSGAPSARMVTATTS